MSDNEIRENFLESKEWVNETNDLKQIKEKAIGVDIDEAEITNMSDDVDRCVDVLITKMEIFKFEDDIRGLFTGTNKNLSRENVVFPGKFAGEPGDNVFKFKAKFLEALHDSQVREKDKVEVLRKHLTGNAKTLLGDHYTDIEKAMQSLIEYFGNKNKIWSKCKNEFLNHFSGNPRKIWGLYGENKRVMAISKVMEFLRQAIELAESCKELKNEIYHSSTLKTVTQVLPVEYYEKLNEITTIDAEPKEVIESALKLLDAKRDIKGQNFRESRS